MGKTHLAVALAVKAAHAGTSIYFTTMADLVAKLRTDESSARNTNARSYHKAGLVVVDEVGYTPIDRKECYLFFRFVSRRYENASLGITSNKGFTEWTELFEDPVLVTALLDRLLHHSVIITIKGQSYRLKGKLAQTRKTGVGLSRSDEGLIKVEHRRIQPIRVLSGSSRWGTSLMGCKSPTANCPIRAVSISDVWGGNELYEARK